MTADNDIDAVEKAFEAGYNAAEKGLNLAEGRKLIRENTEQEDVEAPEGPHN